MMGRLVQGAFAAALAAGIFAAAGCSGDVRESPPGAGGGGSDTGGAGTTSTSSTTGTSSCPEDDGLAACGDGCVDLLHDPANCGACGAACAGGEVCAAGACEDAHCAPGAVENCATPEDDDCDGVANQGCTYSSCATLIAANPGFPSGIHTIDPDGQGPQEPIEVFCDMATDGGGWTLVARSYKLIYGPVASWVDLLSNNYFGNDTVVANPQVPAGYGDNYAFFAILAATSQMRFGEIRLRDGFGEHVQSLQAAKTMAMIHDADGVEPLYRNGVNTGVLLLLGNSLHTSPLLPCFYPDIDAAGCELFFDGDTGSQTTAFYVGDLSACSGGPAPGVVSEALWGSGDCYQADEAGGYGGFTYHRPINAKQGTGSWVDGGYDGAPWEIYYR